jgi:hypothetical protein
MDQAAVRMMSTFLPFVLAAAAGGSPGDAFLDAPASVSSLTLLISLVLAAVPTRRKQALRDLLGRTRVVTVVAADPIVAADLR